MKKRVFVISHSHWDREWYMPYEQHHMRLVELVDNLLYLFKNDPDFNSFHLDGQVIALDDYLQVRPEKKGEIENYIKQGKLQIGPFYILQDDFLISPESNVRNTLIGKKEANKYGNSVPLGYFPDTFGNMGQAPQMLRLSELNAAAFGRGVTPTGLNNQVQDGKYISKFSEMWWESPDKSKVLGILFANWYSNANEIPVEKNKAKEFWDKKLADAEKYAATNDLLMMNGVDHQPVQMNISKAIKVANELYPDYEFIHSNFRDYLKALKEDLPSNLESVHGELTSQETDGWYTLANTASSRIYLKQKNTEVERLLENIAEPLATMAFDYADYPHDKLTYAWKTLLQNHPHDSICGCSIDPVHQEMMTRFAKAKEVGNFVANDALNTLANKIDTSKFPKDSKPFVIANTAGYKKSGTVEIEILWDQLKLQNPEGPKVQYDKLQQELLDLPDLEVIDANGKVVPSEILKTKVKFGYDLPKDKFRNAYQGLYVTIQMHVEGMAPFSWGTYALKVGVNKTIENTKIVSNNGRKLENKKICVEINDNGTLKITDKIHQRTYNNQLVFEDTGDMGNEYIYRQTADHESILSSDSPSEVKIIQNNNFGGKVEITQIMMIPDAADTTLAKEQQSIVDITKRTAKRSNIYRRLVLRTQISLDKTSDQLLFKTGFENKMKDHRLRVLFKTGIMSDHHYADSIFETVKRSNDVSKQWLNPTNPQHEQSFVHLRNKQQGVTVNNYGLNEYEVLKQTGTIAITLLRSVGEMGDWGYFPTPDAQCLGKHSVQYGISFTSDSTDSYINSFQEAKADQIPFSVKQTNIHDGEFDANQDFVSVEGNKFAITSLKQGEDQNSVVLRGYNLTDEDTNIRVKIGKMSVKQVNLMEHDMDDDVDHLQPCEIKTLKFV